MNFVLDTNVVLYLLGGRLAEALPDGDYFISVMTELELLSYARIDEEGELSIRALLQDLAIVDLNDDVKAAAIRLRRGNRLKLPDAIVSATAYTLSATLLTCDSTLLKLTDVRSFAPRLTSQTLSI